MCLVLERWVKVLWHAHAVEYYLGMKKDETPPFATTGLGLKGIMLRELSPTEKDKHHVIS